MNKQDPKILDLTALYNVAEEIIQNYKEQLEIDNAVASGDLLNSIEWNIVQKDENTLTLEMSLFDYWFYVEYGRNPTSKNETKWVDSVGDIERWYIAKMKKGKLIPKPNQEIPTTQKEIRKVAYAIVQKIHNFGFYEYYNEGKHSLEKSLQRSEEEKLIERFAMALTQPLCGEVVSELNKIETRKKPKPKRTQNI